MKKISSNYFTASDGAKLHYLKSGEGKTILMLPGGGISADVFKHQIEELSKKYEVISLDKRGHGKSEKVDYGYRVSRFAKDLYELLSHLEIDEVILLCHSLGASMAYEYIDLFGIQKISKFVIVDEPACLLKNPMWSEVERRNYGAIYDAGTLHQLTNGFMDEDSEELKHRIVNMMTTRFATQEQKEFILSCLNIPGPAAARLYLNNICQDFRDVLNKIDIPTLLVMGKASLHPWQSLEWMSREIPSSQLVLFSEEEGGGHFTFVENPEKFNRVLSTFLDE